MYKVLNTDAANLKKSEIHHARLAIRLEACEAKVISYREGHPGGGLRKIYELWRRLDEEHIRGISRDRFIGWMKSKGLVVNPFFTYPRTTKSGPRRVANQVSDTLVSYPHQVWVSDTTYFKMNTNKHYYITFVMDVYTRLIVGYAVSRSLHATANVAALKMAIDRVGERVLRGQEIGLIFHTDGGAQYLEKAFKETLHGVNGRSSMGFIAQDNAYAERVNGTIKHEYLLHWSQTRRSFAGLKQGVEQAVESYNGVRPHDNLPNKQRPEEFAQSWSDGQHRDYEEWIKPLSYGPPPRPKDEPLNSSNNHQETN